MAMLGAPCSPCCISTCSLAGLESSVQGISVQWETSGLSSGTWPLGSAGGAFTDPEGNIVVQSSIAGGYAANGGDTKLLIPGSNYIPQQPNPDGIYSPFGQTAQILSPLSGFDFDVSNKLMAIFYCGTESTWTITGTYLWVQLIADVVAAEVVTTFTGSWTNMRGGYTPGQPFGVNVGYSSANPFFDGISTPGANPQYFFRTNPLRSWIQWTGDRPTTYGTVTIDKYILATDKPYLWTYTSAFRGLTLRNQKVVARFLLPPTIIGEVQGQEYEIYGSTTISTNQHQQIRAPFTDWADRVSITGYGLLRPQGWNNTAVGRIEPVQEYIDRYPLNTPYHDFTGTLDQSTFFFTPASAGGFGVHPGVNLGAGQFGTVRQGPTFTATITRQ